MLDFLKESHQGQKEQQGSNLKDENGHAVSLNPNDDSQQYLTVPDKSSQLRKSTYLFAVLFIVGVVCLFVMIKKSTPAAASASPDSDKKVEQAQIENAISKITGIRTQMFSNLERIVTKFYEFSDVEQVNVGELAKNPFKEDSYIGPVKADNAQSQFALLQDELELLSIMSTGKGYCCMINDKILYEGDSIKGLEVAKITSNEVVLNSGSVSMTLKLSEDF